MCDEFSARYGDLLTGSYDCVDRIVLNAYFSLAHSLGGFRTWWRRWHDDRDDELDNSHLMRMAGRFSRRVRKWAQVNSVPVIDCKAGERKHLVAEEYLRDHPGTESQMPFGVPAGVRTDRRHRPGGRVEHREEGP